MRGLEVSLLSPDDIVSIIAVGDGDDVRAVGVVVGEHVLTTVMSERGFISGLA